MKKKLFSSLGLALFASVTITAGVSAETSEDKALQTAEQNTEKFEVNWDKAWENADQLNSTTDFGTTNDSSSGKIQAAASSWGSLASGSTSVVSDFISGNVDSTGTSKGKVLTTVTSATTSVRDASTGVSVDGNKSTAVAKFTAESTASISAVSGLYQGLTVHTATDSGVLYDSRTSDSTYYVQ